MKWITLILFMITTTAESIDFVVSPVNSEQRQAFENIAPDLLLWGIGGTGKTHVGAEKAILVGCMYPNNRILLIRKKKTDLRVTLWQRFCELLPEEMIVKRNDTTMYIKIRNGTEFLGLGLDSAQEVNKLASLEAGLIIVEEATEVPEQYYDEKIRRACRLPRVPFHQVVLLCNPGPPTHWIKRRWLDETRDSYDDIFFKTLVPFLPKEWLDWFYSLTGIFAARYRDGKWVGAEGLVYPYDQSIHQVPGKIVKQIFSIPEDWKRVVSLDFGFSLMHPFVTQWWTISPKDVWYCYRQLYITGKTVGQLIPQIKSYMKNDGILHQAILCDHDAEDRATLNLEGIRTKPAKKQRLAGQRNVHDLIAHKPKPKLYFFRNSLVEEDLELKMHKLPVRTEEEFGFYTWANKDKEDMIKKYDHGMDTMRYAVHSTMKKSKDLLYGAY